MALKFVTGIEATSVSLSSYLDLAKNELRNPQIHNLTTTQINGISSPATGQIAYDTTIGQFKHYDGSNWLPTGIPGDNTTIEISGTTLRVKDAGISAAKLASNAVTTVKINDGAVTTAKLGADAVTGAKIADDAVDTEHLAAGAVDAAAIAANVVGAAKLNVSGTGTSGQALTSDGDGSFSWTTVSTTDNDVNVGNLISRLSEIATSFNIGADPSAQATFAGKVIVSGDLQVDGTTTTVNSTVMTVDDPILTLGGDTAPTADDNKDRGVEFRYFQTSAKIGFFGMDETDNTFKFIPDATNTSEVFSGALGNAKFAEVDMNTLSLGGTTTSVTATELDILSNATVTTAELNKLDGLTASTTELNKVDGLTATTTELNLLDGVTATTAELNILDGVTATASELNTMDGITATTAELNKMDGVTATTTEINYLDGVSSAIQTQIDAKANRYKGTVTVNSNTATIAEATHGISYPANIQVYDTAGRLVMIDIRQSPSGDNDITINGEDGDYDFIIIGQPA